MLGRCRTDISGVKSAARSWIMTTQFGYSSVIIRDTINAEIVPVYLSKGAKLHPFLKTSYAIAQALMPCQDKFLQLIQVLKVTSLLILGPFSENERSVGSAKAKRIGKSHLDLSFAGHVGDIVQVAVRIREFVIYGWGH